MFDLFKNYYYNYQLTIGRRQLSFLNHLVTMWFLLAMFETANAFCVSATKSTKSSLLVRNTHNMNRNLQQRKVSSTRTTITSSTSLSSSSSSNLWSIEECLENRENIKFVDASWYHKGGRNGRQEFEAGPRIPGAQFFDMMDISASKELFPELNPKGLYTMFPPTPLFAAAMDAMDIENDDQVVIYGRKGCWFTPRTWYMFKTYGQGSNVKLMQGSLEEWIEKGGPVDEGLVSCDIWAKDLIEDGATQQDDFKYQISSTARDRLVDMDFVKSVVLNNDEDDKEATKTTIVDTRGSSFAKGHIPGAIQIGYSSLVIPTTEDHPGDTLKMKPKEELEQILKSNNISKERPTLLTCGSAVSVCHMALVLDECDYPQPFIYDGSYNEWGSDPSTPKATS